MVETTVSATAVRRLAVAAQGYAGRYRRATESDVETRSAGCRASSSTRSRRSSAVTGSRSRAASAITPAKRLGSARQGPDLRVLGARGMPAPDRIVAALPARDAATAAATGTATSTTSSPPYPGARRTEILARIREDGPLASRQFEGAAGGGMWNWKPAKAMLERLWNHGELVIAGRQGFQRVYDLAERVIPRAQLEAPVPSPTRCSERSPSRRCGRAAR